MLFSLQVIFFNPVIERGRRLQRQKKVFSKQHGAFKCAHGHWSSMYTSLHSSLQTFLMSVSWSLKNVIFRGTTLSWCVRERETPVERERDTARERYIYILVKGEIYTGSERDIYW